MVTGYTDPDNQKCESCPFRIEIMKGWPPVHDKWECRAGSRPPNQKSEWHGSINDKATMSVWSLDHELMETIIAFCREHPELGASYNQDLDDCRRVVSVSCSANKKGMAAKKELVDKFFGEKEEPERGCPYFKGSIGPLDAKMPEIKCGDNAILSFSHAGEFYSKLRICNGNQQSCRAFLVRELEKMGQRPQSNWDTEAMKEIYQSLVSGIEPSAKDEKKEDASDVNCKISKCGFNNESGGCGFETNDTNNKVFTEYAQEAIKLGCTNEELKQAFRDQPCLGTSPKKPRDIISEVCNEMREDCPCFCAHNDGCAAMIMRGNVKIDYLKEISTKHGPIECDEFKKIYEKHFPCKEILNEVMIDLVKPEDGNLEEDKTQPFDDRLVDPGTSAFLQEKEAKITQIRMMTVIAIGKEFNEVHEKLASHYQGTFGKWCKHIGFSRDTAENYIRAYKYVAENFGNIEDADQLQPSLLFAISKPSAPAELQKAVIDGDITTHKQYKELEARLKAAEQKAETESNAYQRVSDSYDVLEKKNSEHYEKAEQLRKELEALKATNEHAAIERLEKELKEAERQVEILTDEIMKPVDVEPAVVEKEVEKAADKDFEYVAEFLGKFMTVHTGQLKNWAKVLGENNNRHDLEGIKQNLIALNRNIGNMLDAIEDEISNK